MTSTIESSNNNSPFNLKYTSSLHRHNQKHSNQPQPLHNTEQLTTIFTLNTKLLSHTSNWTDPHQSKKPQTRLQVQGCHQKHWNRPLNPFETKFLWRTVSYFFTFLYIHLNRPSLVRKVKNKTPSPRLCDPKT